MISNKTLILTTIAGILLALTIVGCTPGPGDGVEPTQDIVMDNIKPIDATGDGKVETHPWLHKEFWESIADDDTDEYNFECAYGVPFIRRDGYPPIYMDQGNTGRPLEKRIKRMLWEVCGNKTWRAWSNEVRK